VDKAIFSFGVLITHMSPSMALPQKSVAESWTGSVQGAVATWSTSGVKIVRKYLLLITDQVATAPCTDPVQVQILTFEAKPIGPNSSGIATDQRIH